MLENSAKPNPYKQGDLTEGTPLLQTIIYVESI